MFEISPVIQKHHQKLLQKTVSERTQVEDYTRRWSSNREAVCGMKLLISRIAEPLVFQFSPIFDFGKLNWWKYFHILVPPFDFSFLLRNKKNKEKGKRSLSPPSWEHPNEQNITLRKIKHKREQKKLPVSRTFHSTFIFWTNIFFLNFKQTICYIFVLNISLNVTHQTRKDHCCPLLENFYPLLNNMHSKKRISTKNRLDFKIKL